MNTPQHATRTELASTLQQSGLSVRAFCTSAGLPKTTVRRFLIGKVVRPSTHNQIHKALRAYQADRLTAVQSANAASRQCYLDGVTLVDDLLESEKSRLREQVARLEVTVRTQAENIAAYQKSLLECDQQCERKQLMIRGLRVQIGEEMKQNIEYRQRVMDAMHDHALTIDATRQAHAVLMHQIAIEQNNFRKQGWTVWFLIVLLAICCAAMSFGGVQS